MQINEEEARSVLSSIGCAEFEHGEDPYVRERLAIRIRAEFPAIDREIVVREQKNHIWSVLAEQDPRVKKARAKMEKSGYRDPGYAAIQDDFFRIKEIVNKELLEKAKVSGNDRGEMDSVRSQSGTNKGNS
jgi:hypothetical protein